GAPAGPARGCRAPESRSADRPVPPVAGRGGRLAGGDRRPGRSGRHSRPCCPMVVCSCEVSSEVWPAVTPDAGSAGPSITFFSRTDRGRKTDGGQLTGSGNFREGVSLGGA